MVEPKEETQGAEPKAAAKKGKAGTVRAQPRMGRSRTKTFIKGGAIRWRDGHLASGQAGDVPTEIVERANSRDHGPKFVAEGSEIEGKAWHPPILPGDPVPKEYTE